MIVLDTHTLIWWVDSPQKLSRKAKKAIEESEKKSAIYISSITVFEIYLLLKKGKLELSSSPDIWFSKIESLPFLSFVPVNNKIAAESVKMDISHQDLADRMIIATAQYLGAKLVTADKKILNYPHVQSVW